MHKTGGLVQLIVEGSSLDNGMGQETREQSNFEIDITRPVAWQCHRALSVVSHGN